MPTSSLQTMCLDLSERPDLPEKNTKYIWPAGHKKSCRMPQITGNRLTMAKIFKGGTWNQPMSMHFEVNTGG